jgi:hypothetical protein
LGEEQHKTYLVVCLASIELPKSQKGPKAQNSNFCVTYSGGMKDGCNVEIYVSVFPNLSWGGKTNQLQMQTS